MDKTLTEYRTVIGRCRDLFLKKTTDYGTAWRILRPSSITDQLYIKAMRIRSIEEKGVQKVDDPVEGEFIGLVNYCIMAMIQLEIGDSELPLELDLTTVERLYDAQVEQNIHLLQAKNHDYGEVWRFMRISSMTDLILQKLFRIKQIEDNSGKTIVSEGLEANYRDILNYAIFAMILST